MFDTSSKIIVGNLVEVGEQVCKGGGKECSAADLQGFKVRSNTGAPWVDRKAGGKLDSDKVIPLKPTPLMDAVMSGSPDQVRQEAYKQRTANMRAIVGRLTSLAERAVRGHEQGRRPSRRLHAVLDVAILRALRGSAGGRAEGMPSAADGEVAFGWRTTMAPSGVGWQASPRTATQRLLMPRGGIPSALPQLAPSVHSASIRPPDAAQRLECSARPARLRRELSEPDNPNLADGPTERSERRRGARAGRGEDLGGRERSAPTPSAASVASGATEGAMGGPPPEGDRPAESPSARPPHAESEPRQGGPPPKATVPRRASPRPARPTP